MKEKTACGIVRKLFFAGLIIFGLAFGSLIGLLSASRMISPKGTRFVALVSVLFVISAGAFAAFKRIVFADLSFSAYFDKRKRLCFLFF
nr:hypothetical protein P5667_18835 [Bacillus velezensis]